MKKFKGKICPICGEENVVESSVPNYNGADDCSMFCRVCKFECRIYDNKNIAILEILMDAFRVFKGE